MDAFNLLREEILSRITANPDYIQVAYFSERDSFDGSPAAVIGVSSNEALYNSQSTDKITLVFTIRIYVPLTDKSEYEETERRLGQAFWYVLTQFTKRDALGAHADFVEPIPSVWGWEENTTTGAVYRYAEINVRCKKFLTQTLT